MFILWGEEKRFNLCGFVMTDWKKFGLNQASQKHLPFLILLHSDWWTDHPAMREKHLATGLRDASVIDVIVSSLKYNYMFKTP